VLKNKTAPWFKPARAAPSTVRQCVNSLIVLPLLVPLIFVRGPDVLYFDDAWCDYAGGPMPIFMATLSLAFGLIKLASRRPGQALVVAVALLAWVKQRADETVPPPVVPGIYETMSNGGGSSAATPLTALVTGANSGVGFAVALELARSGHTVLLACRSVAKCDAARTNLLLALGDEAVGRRAFSRPEMAKLLEQEASRQLLHGEWSMNAQWKEADETHEEGEQRAAAGEVKTRDADEEKVSEEESEDEEEVEDDEESEDEEDDEFAGHASKKAPSLNPRAKLDAKRKAKKVCVNSVG
jgi:hypothetical protein